MSKSVVLSTVVVAILFIGFPFCQVFSEDEIPDKDCDLKFGYCIIPSNETCEKEYHLGEEKCDDIGNECCEPTDHTLIEWTLDDYECLVLFGNCQHYSISCNGTWHWDANVCGGPNERKCCHPGQEQIDMWAERDIKCWDATGNCQSNLTICHGGSYVQDKCGGPEDRLCCEPSAETIELWETEDTNCHLEYGICQHINASCDGLFHEFSDQECGGPEYRACCEPDSKTVEEWKKNSTECYYGFGTCQVLQEPCLGNYEWNSDLFCDGPDNIQCCAPKKEIVTEWKLDDYECAVLFGNCQYFEIPCYGTWHWDFNVCGGPNERQCCHPSQEQVDMWAERDIKCWEAMGNCQSNLTICHEGEYNVEKCGGPEDRLCCVPSPSTIEDWEKGDEKCYSDFGTCQHLNATCDMVIHEYSDRECGGPDYRICCEPDAETVDEWEKNDTSCIYEFGECQLKKQYCGAEWRTDKTCGGPDDRQCCAPSSETIQKWSLSDTGCMRMYGNCQHYTVPCYGTWKKEADLCGGPNERICCHPGQDQINMWAERDQQCWEMMGNCQNNLTICDEGNYAVNKCGGPEDRLCCVPDSHTLHLWEENDDACKKKSGYCQHMNASCDGPMDTKDCGGPEYRKCCRSASGGHTPSNTPPIGAIIGGVLGGIVLLGLLTFIITRQRGSKYRQTPHSITNVNWSETNDDDVDLTQNEMPMYADN